MIALPHPCLIRRPVLYVFPRVLKRSLGTTRTQVKAEDGLDRSPLQFISNSILTTNSKLARALSCTDDVSTKPTLETSHIPFEVKQKDVNGTDIKTAQKGLIAPYVALSKPRLTALVVLSAICSYALTPYNATIPQLLNLTLGTALCSASANAINQAREPDFDKLMARTVGRPIVRGLLTPKQAYEFAAVAGTVGVTVLCAGVNTTVGLLGAANIVLYAWMYTSLKRTHIINTWVGALVGAIPPLMGWASSSPLSDPGAWCLAALLYAWQFPHFNALSHGIRQDYKGAGYVMTCFVNPRLNARVGFRYALLMFPICFLLTYYGVTDSVFPLDSGILNGWMAYWSFMFWKQQRINYAKGKTPTAEGMKLANMYAKKTFWASVWHLPGVLILAMLHKKGRWDWLFGKDGAFES